uniref:RRM domain-containing protein n=1 Tax=Panagrolaimus sp. ES5 TaxID=591445 RepID=A0AC34FUZ5_9BILA
MMPRFPPPSRPQPQQQPSEKAMRSVYVGNIGFDVNEEELKQILSKIGPVIGFRIVHDRETGKSKGFGFCEYLDPDTANRCIRQLNNLEFKGRNLRIDSAVLNERAMNDDSSAPMGSMPPMRNQSPHNETSMYGPAPLNGKTPEAIAKTLSKCSPEIMFEVMKDMKNLATTNPQRCRQLLETNQQLAFALLQAQVMMHWLDTDAAFNLIDRKTNQEKAAAVAAEAPAPVAAAAPEPSHVQARQPLRPTPSQAPAPFRPPPPQQSEQQQLQFFQHTPPAQQQQPFRQQFFPPQQPQQSGPPQRPPSSSAGPWSGGPPQRMPNAPPPQQDDAEDYEMIEQLLQLTDDQINQLPAHEAAKIREIRAQLAHR